MADWNDENKAELVKQYLAAKPTPETSMEIVASLAPDFDTTPNGARMILMKADVYIKKDPKAGKASTSTASGEKKETKQESLDRLTAVIEAQGLDADDTIISKMTGKAAAYFADTFTKALSTDESE